VPLFIYAHDEGARNVWHEHLGQHVRRRLSHECWDQQKYRRNMLADMAVDLTRGFFLDFSVADGKRIEERSGYGP